MMNEVIPNSARSGRAHGRRLRGRRREAGGDDVDPDVEAEINELSMMSYRGFKARLNGEKDPKVNGKHVWKENPEEAYQYLMAHRPQIEGRIPLLLRLAENHLG